MQSIQVTQTPSSSVIEMLVSSNPQCFGEAIATRTRGFGVLALALGKLRWNCDPTCQIRVKSDKLDIIDSAWETC
jgi:hypothetical protein